jgi:hypothetical protein
MQSWLRSALLESTDVKVEEVNCMSSILEIGREGFHSFELAK